MVTTQEFRQSHTSGKTENIHHDIGIVSLAHRRDPLTMGLVWVTMVTAFPTLLIGFQWFKEGLTLPQVVSCAALSCLMLLVYAIPACHLGAYSGQGYGHLSRSVFGRWGARLVSLNLIWVFLAWYGLCALFMADGLKGLFHADFQLLWVAPVIAILMAFNNYFGFAGVANFARYLAAPVLVAWGLYTFVKAGTACPISVFTELPHKSFLSALTTVSSFVIGFAVWGNEPDYWRYGKPKAAFSAIPIVIALLIGQIIFPATGWMVAHMTAITDYAAATSFMNNYSFGGIALIGALVLAASYFAANDSNLFGSISAVENLYKMPHKLVVSLLAVAGAVVAALMSIAGSSAAVESVAALNCIILPTPTVIILTDWFLLTKVLRIKPDFSRIPELHELPPVRWSAVIALTFGLLVGIATSGVIPGTEFLHVGVASVQAWITSALVFIPLRLLEHGQESSAQSINLRTLGSKQMEPLVVYALDDSSDG